MVLENEELEEYEDRKAAGQAWVITETIHLEWHEAQVNYVETGQESYKQ